jgi:hypothetical protein
MNRILTVKEFKQQIAELCKETGFGVELKSIHHPEGDGVEPDGVNPDSLETMEIEIPMNKRLKELIEQAGLSALLGNNWLYGEELERFAELVRDDERAKCASDYLQDCCDAIDAARLEEREACAALVEGGNHVHEKAPDFVWAKTIAKLIRARGEPDPSFKNYMGDNWAGIV